MDQAGQKEVTKSSLEAAQSSLGGREQSGPALAAAAAAAVAAAAAAAAAHHPLSIILNKEWLRPAGRSTELRPSLFSIINKSRSEPWKSCFRLKHP